jgi:hypothetical protein
VTCAAQHEQTTSRGVQHPLCRCVDVGNFKTRCSEQQPCHLAEEDCDTASRGLLQDKTLDQVIGDQQHNMSGARVVCFVFKDEDDAVEFKFPEGSCMEVSTEDVGRSCPLQDMLDSASASGDSTLTLPSAVECTHLQHCCETVRLSGGEFPSDAGRIVQCQEVYSYASGIPGSLILFNELQQ